MKKQCLLSTWEGKLNSLQKNILSMKIYYLVKKRMKILILLSSENSYGLIRLFRHSPTQQGYLRTALHAGMGLCPSVDPLQKSKFLSACDLSGRIPGTGLLERALYSSSSSTLPQLAIQYWG